jgi:hypothetical protein
MLHQKDYEDLIALQLDGEQKLPDIMVDGQLLLVSDSSGRFAEFQRDQIEAWLLRGDITLFGNHGPRTLFMICAKDKTIENHRNALEAQPRPREREADLTIHDEVEGADVATAVDMLSGPWPYPRAVRDILDEDMDAPTSNWVRVCGQQRIEDWLARQLSKLEAVIIVLGLSRRHHSDGMPNCSAVCETNMSALSGEYSCTPGEPDPIWHVSLTFSDGHVTNLLTVGPPRPNFNTVIHINDLAAVTGELYFLPTPTGWYAGLRNGTIVYYSRGSSVGTLLSYGVGPADWQLRRSLAKKLNLSLEQLR